MAVFEYYYHMLKSDADKHNYNLIKSAIQMRNSSIHISNVKQTAALIDLYEDVMLDHPEFFYVKSAECLLGGGRPRKIEFTYRFSNNEIQALNIAAQNRANTLLSKISEKDEDEKVKAIHDYIIDIVEYKDLDAPYSHEMPGTLIYGIGVCEGIAKTFKYLCDLCEIKSGVIIGNADEEQNTTVDENTSHAWNVVKLGEEYSLLDVTFDYSLTTSIKEKRYDYFLLSDKEMSNHKSLKPIVRCHYSYKYYERIGHFAYRSSDLERMVLLEFMNERELTFQMPRFNESYEKIKNSIFGVVKDALRNTSIQTGTIALSGNDKRMIFTVSLE